MPESEHVQRDIGALRTDLEMIKSMQRLMVASSKDVKQHVENILSRRDNAPEIIVFLSSGPKRQEEIGRHLGKSQGPVSTALKYLYTHGLLVQYRDGKGKCWGLNPLETALDAVSIANAIIRKRAKTQN